MVQSSEQKIGAVSPIRSGYSSGYAADEYRVVNNRVNTNSKNKDAFRLARGVGIGTRENYFAGYYGFGVDADTYSVSKNGYLDKVQRSFELIA